MQTAELLPILFLTPGEKTGITPFTSVPKTDRFLQSFVQVFPVLYLNHAGYLYHSSSLSCPAGVKTHFLPLTDLKVPISIAH